jgi:hypothetical protein
VGFKPMLDEWRESRETRAEMPMGERNAYMENDLGGNMSPDRGAFWRCLFGPAAHQSVERGIGD